jgi:hypothetical protein
LPDVSLPKFPEKYRLTPEFKLLVACSWIAPPELEHEQADKIASLCRDGIAWDAFLSLVCKHGVQALVYEVLFRYGSDNIPEHIRESLKSQKIQICATSLQHASELLYLITKFSEQDIELLPLKGVALSLQLYGDISMRSSCDLDILVRSEDLEKVDHILEAEGYSCSLLGNQLTAKQRAYLETNFHHLEYGHTVKRICLELHWRFGSLWPPDQMSMCWDRTAQIELMGRPINCLDDDLQLLFLCDHGARHGFDSLKWLSDIASILSSKRSKDWESLHELAECLDLKRTLASSALLAKWLYGISLPEELNELIRKDKKAVSISITIYTMLCLDGTAKNSMGKSQGSLNLSWQKLRLRPSFPISAALKPKLVAIFDFLDFPLPDSLFWLYYPLRPVSLIWRHFFRRSPRGI